MKILLLSILLPVICFAQKNYAPVSDNVLWNQIASKPDKSSYENIQFEMSSIESSIKTYYLKLPELSASGSDIVLVSNLKSPIGNHLFFQQYYKNVPVYGGYLKVNINLNGVQLSCFNHLYNSANWNSISPQNDAAKGEAIFVAQNDQLISAYRKFSNAYEIINDVNGGLLFSNDQRVYFCKDDTTINAMVFHPDPLSTAQVLYGQNGTYRNFNDMDYALLNNQRMAVTFPGTFKNDSFYLENQYAKSVDINPPTIPPTVLKTDSFYFNRSTSSFKEVMCMYHIYLVQQFINTIGFSGYPPFQINVDAEDGYADNSYFNPSDSSLNMGIGGVPDAEDADVITHEYTHSITHTINTNGVTSNERHALDEAMSDIMATTHSYTFTPFNWRWVFNWDGHNEFWQGRDASTICGSLTPPRMKTYKDYDSNDYYYSSEIWSSTIDDIVMVTSRAIAFKLMFTALYSFTPNSTMPEAANLMLQADSIIFGKTYNWKIGPLFTQRFILNYPVGIPTVSKNAGFKMYNTVGFADGTSAMNIDLSTPSSISITNINGQQIKEFKNVSNKFYLSPELFSSGMYFITIENDNGIFTSKLCRF